MINLDEILLCKCYIFMADFASLLTEEILNFLTEIIMYIYLLAYTLLNIYIDFVNIRKYYEANFDNIYMNNLWLFIDNKIWTNFR